VGQFAQQRLGDRSQLGLGVTHRREALGVVGRAEVALAIDQWVAVRKRLRHQHQRFVAGTVAMRVELADHIADGTRGLFRLGAGVEAQFAHRVNDPPLHRLEAVADEWQGAIEHHVHRIVEIGAFGVFAQRNLFEAVKSGTCGVGHVLRSRCVGDRGAILPASVRFRVGAQRVTPGLRSPGFRPVASTRATPVA